MASALVVALGTSPALAQTSGFDKAQAHFAAGRKHRAMGRCDLAIEDFAQAVDFEPNKIGPHLNLGDCYAELGRLPEAFRQFKEAERCAEIAKDERRLASARQASASVEAKMVRVIVREDEERTANISVQVDGVSIGTAPWLIVVAPGVEHDIRATTPDGREWSAKAGGAAGDVVRLTIAFSPSAVEPAPAPAPKVERPPAVEPDKPHSALRSAAFIVGGVGVVGIAAGAISGAMALDARSELASAVKNDPRCSHTYPGGCSADARSSIEPRQDRAYTAATISTVSFVAGAALLVGGLTLYWFSREGTKHDVRAAIGPRSMVLEGRF